MGAANEHQLFEARKAVVMDVSGVKQQQRWQKKIILLQQQLFQDEYSVSRKDTAIGAVATCKAKESVKRA